jgi:hypothetical protein
MFCLLQLYVKYFTFKFVKLTLENILCWYIIIKINITYQPQLKMSFPGLFTYAR